MVTHKHSSPLLIKYIKAFESNPESKVFAPLAETYRKMGMLNKAKEILSIGLKHNPHYVSGIVCLANCLYDEKNFKMAYDFLKKIVHENIDNIKMQRLFADTCLVLNKYSESLQTYKYLLYINPKDLDVSKKVEELEKKDNNAVISNEKKEIAQDEWRSVDFSNNAPEDSIILDDKKLNLGIGPTADNINSSFENLFEEKNFSDDSSDQVESSLTKLNNSPVITYTLVELYVAQGHFKKALEVLNKFVELGHSDDEIEKKIEEVKKLIKVDNSKVSENKTNTFETSDESVEDTPLMIFDEDDSSEDLVEEKGPEVSGQDDLMGLYDSKFSNKQFPNKTVLEQKFNSFLAQIKSRAECHYRS